GSPFNRGPLRQVQQNAQLALVVGRNPISSDQRIEGKSQRERRERHKDDDTPVIERPLQRADIAPVYPPEKPRILRGVPDRRSLVRHGVRRFSRKTLEQARAEHGRESEAHEHRDHDREGHRPAELIHVAARVACHEGNGHENDDQRKGRGHDRQRDLLGRRDGGLFGFEIFLLDVAHYVFKHDDRVVDDDSHGERQRQQRHIVEREVHRLEHREGGDYRSGDSDGGNDDRAQVLDEKQHTRLASRLPNRRCSSSDAIEALMKTDWSRMILRAIPAGSAFWICSSRFLTASTIRTVFVPDCRRTSRVTACLPSSMFQERGSAKLSSTRPRSFTRMGVPLILATMMSPNWRTASTRPSVRTPTSDSPRTMRPPGISTF